MASVGGQNTPSLGVPIDRAESPSDTIRTVRNQDSKTRLATVSDTTTNKRRKWNWTKFFTGKDRGIFFVGLVLITLPCVLFSVFVIPQFSQGSAAVIAVFVWIWAVTKASMFRTSFSDPGYLPKNLEPEPQVTADSTGAFEPHPPAPSHTYQPTNIGQSSVSYPPGSLPQPQTSSTSLPRSYPFITPSNAAQRTAIYSPEPRIVQIGHTSMTLKYCTTCHVWRPARASHCSSCDRCVNNHDHHCPWMANCVGKRNYRYFYSFLCSCSALALYIFAFSLAGLLKTSRDGTRSDNSEEGGFLWAIRREPVNLVLMVYCFLIGWSVVGMSCYHTFISCNGVTTHEQLKQHVHEQTMLHGRSSRGNEEPSLYPFSRGSGWKNWSWLLCRTAEPSYDAMDLESSQVHRLSIHPEPVTSSDTHAHT
ncbi:uncharacterized protein SPPG_07424 [Spizellomyces punctatus DAOM BR117]|uniref:Palmitoyltransferase n=1 Tax=Spizellomyces punctatus (strain DAOM BR117) TaxID=645134 RepID=A0A0L0H987_SPIPD|nr:uncharacterized protein SPPG_07424 [Spizellomyces punctatus DAOM BR117]KNC97509.1 hypothetical protein SPPG_07424 [Spizellomyces punctatus DAOM BR117]|eukprot:XP_016605549.1 hypothetical protein SPPG_07424 [Spizellomyces punctatus DAOM BR117]